MSRQQLASRTAVEHRTGALKPAAHAELVIRAFKGRNDGRQEMSLLGDDIWRLAIPVLITLQTGQRNLEHTHQQLVTQNRAQLGELSRRYR
jgi:hypothetical protein